MLLYSKIIQATYSAYRTQKKRREKKSKEFFSYIVFNWDFPLQGSYQQHRCQVSDVTDCTAMAGSIFFKIRAAASPHETCLYLGHRSSCPPWLEFSNPNLPHLKTLMISCYCGPYLYVTFNLSLFFFNVMVVWRYEWARLGEWRKEGRREVGKEAVGFGCWISCQYLGLVGLLRIEIWFSFSWITEFGKRKKKQSISQSLRGIS